MPWNDQSPWIDKYSHMEEGEKGSYEKVAGTLIPPGDSTGTKL